MIKGLISHLISFIIAFVLLLVVIYFCPNTIKDHTETVVKGTQKKVMGYHSNLTSGEQAEIDFISSLVSEDQLTIFGSSEFNGSEYCPYSFLPNNFGYNVMGLGHQFHQQFSILGELAAANEYLENSKVSIIISPGWFSTSGTNSNAFIEFLRPNFLKKIALDTTLSEDIKLAIGKFIHEKYGEFEGVTYEMDVLREIYLQSKGVLSQRILSSFRSSIRQKFERTYHIQPVSYEVNLLDSEMGPKSKDLRFIADSLKSDFIGKISSNEIYVNDAYYTKYLIKKNGSVKTGRFRNVDLDSNQELEDFKMLVKFLKEKSVDCTFILLPFNNYYYRDMGNSPELMQRITSTLDKNEIAYLNLFTETKEEYEPALLRDVMHVGDYGWMKINQFLLDHYYE